MFDVNQITSTLRGMPDQQLQKYAMMHKGDPYILSLAVSESNQRKQLRAAAQAQMAGQQIPKVADQDIAAMAPQQLPEDQGIARLPAPNMQNMADGGIAGYGDAVGGADGGMFNFAQAGSPVVKMAEGGHVPRYQGNTMDGSVVSSNPMFAVPGMAAVQPRAQFTQQGAPENTPLFQRIMESLSASNKERQLAVIEQKIVQGTATDEEKAIYQNEKLKAADGKATGAKYPQSDAVRTKDFPGVTPGFEKMPADQAAPGTAPAAPPAAQQGLGATAPAKAITAEQAREDASKFSDFGEARTALTKLQTDQESTNARLRTTLAEGLPKTPAFQGLEKLLDEQEAKTGGEKDKAAGLALLSAGLAIAGGSSRFALQNLKEAVPAVAQYGEALKDLKKIERENMKMRGDIEQARRAEGREDTKLKMSLEEDIAKRQDKINEMGVNLFTNVAKVDAETATKLWTTAKENESRERTAGITAGAGSPLTLYKTLGAGDAEKGFRLATEIQAGKKTLAQSYEDYMKAFAGKDTTITPPLTPQQWVAQVRTIQMLESGKPPAPIEGKPTRQ